MKKILNALFLTILTLVTFSCSDVPSPYDIMGGDDKTSFEGEGTKDNPYSIADARKKQDGSVAWVKGYIVGIMGNKYKPDGTTFDGNIPVFTAPFDIATNVLIAAEPGETNINNCLPVKIKGGSPLATAINLKDHPENLGKALIITGKLAAGFGMASLIETTGAVFEGKEIGDTGGTDPDVPVGSVTFLDETFLSNQGNFTIKNVLLPDGSDYVWKWASYETNPGYMIASGFVNKVNKASESWLVSPVVNLTKATKASLVFEHAYKFGVDKSKELTLWVTEAAVENWTQITIPTYGTGADWTFVSSGTIALDNYVGKSIKIAFKYISTTEGAASWEVKNVKIVGEGEKGDDPVDPEPSTDNLLTNPSFETWSTTAPDGWGRELVTSVAYSKVSTGAQDGTNAVQLDGTSANARFGAGDISLAAGTYTISVYAKNAVSGKIAKLKMGYVPIVNNAPESASAYEYVGPSTAYSLTDEWAKYEATFEVKNALPLASVFFVNSKSGTGCNILIDNVTLVAAK